jgi:hypothetical protein
MKKTLLIVSFLFLKIALVHSIENRFSGARSLALSNASVSFTDVWSTANNQAGLTFIHSLAAAVYFESKFQIDELELLSGVFALPVKNGTFGLSYYQFGKGSYKEIKTGLAYAKQLGNKWSAGLQLDYFAQTFPENKRAKSLFTFEGGLLFLPNKNLFLGAHFFNPVFQSFNTEFGKIELPAVFRLGGHYQFNALSLLAFEIQKNSKNSFLLKSGVEFSPVKNFSLRFGISGEPILFTAGLGYSFKKTTTDFAFSYHGNLGITPSVSIQFLLP